MRHRKRGRHLSRTTAHRRALRRNMAQSLFQYGEIRTTVTKAKEVRSFVEHLITLARNDSVHARQRVAALLTDRSMIPKEHQEAYDGMTSTHRAKALRGRSGRRIRNGVVPAAYDKKKFPFVAGAVLHHLFKEVAPRYKERPGGYTRIIKMSQRRIGDDSQLAVLQLVGTEKAPASGLRKPPPGRRRQRTERRTRMIEDRLKASGKESTKTESKTASVRVKDDASTATKSDDKTSA